MVSTIFDRESAVLGRYLLIVCLTLLGAGCAGKQVVVEGNFTTPLLDPLPVTLGVIYPPAFAQLEFFDEAKGRAESDWLVKTGEAQVEFWPRPPLTPPSPPSPPEQHFIVGDEHKNMAPLRVVSTDPYSYVSGNYKIHDIFKRS